VLHVEPLAKLLTLLAAQFAHMGQLDMLKRKLFVHIIVVLTDAEVVVAAVQVSVQSKVMALLTVALVTRVDLSKEKNNFTYMYEPKNANK
jgi:hypothetical protein